jgi:thiol-disulfide isomerase/thioredoxin
MLGEDDSSDETGTGVNLAEAEAAPLTSFQSLRGGDASLADYAGTPVILNFFAESCVPCRKEMPDLQRVHEEIGDRVTVLGIDQGDTEEVANAFVNEMGVTYPTGLDPSGDFAREFGVDYLPGTVFITSTGDIVGRHRGRLSYDDLRRLADEHLQ